MERMLSYTDLRTLPRVDLAQAVPLERPFTIFIEPTNICNMRCSFCPVSLPSYREESGFYHDMPMELYQKILVDVKTIGRLKSLKLYFIGEPFLNQHLGEMIKLARAQEITDRIEITTNGSIWREDVLEGLDYLRVSVYTPRVTKITQNVKRWMSERKGMKPHISVKYMPSSPEDEAKFRASYHEVADELIVEPYHNWASTPGLTHPMPNPMSKRNCPYIHYMMVVKANGDVVPCCVDWNASLKLGNVREESLEAIWNGSAREKLIEVHVAGERASLPACCNCDLPELTPDNLDGLTLDAYRARRKR